MTLRRKAWEGKKKPPNLPPEDGFFRAKGGFLTLGSLAFRAFPLSRENSGIYRKLFPITVAGAVSASHGLPCTLNLRTKLSKRYYVYKNN